MVRDAVSLCVVLAGAVGVTGVVYGQHDLVMGACAGLAAAMVAALSGAWGSGGQRREDGCYAEASAPAQKFAFTGGPGYHGVRNARYNHGLNAVTVPVMTNTGEKGADVELDLRTSKTGKDMYVLHRQIVKEQRAKRQGNASTKTRSEVRGGGRKPLKQKGTGNARQGSKRSPLFVGGGVVFGPKPKNWNNKKINVKEKQLAISIALTNKATFDGIVVLDGMEGAIDAPKTKDAIQLFAKAGVDVTSQKVLVVTGERDENLLRSANNLPLVRVVPWDLIQAYDILWASKVIMSKSAVAPIQERYGVGNSHITRGPKLKRRQMRPGYPMGVQLDENGAMVAPTLYIDEDGEVVMGEGDAMMEEAEDESNEAEQE